MKNVLKCFYNILLSKWNLQNKLISQQTCAEAAKCIMKCKVDIVVFLDEIN